MLLELNAHMKSIVTALTIIFSCTTMAQWEDVESLPAAASVRHHPITFSLNGIGYVVAGTKPTVGVLKDFYSYDPVTDGWTTLPDFPGLARGYSYGVTTATKAYLGFGYYENEVTLEGVALNDLWEYDPITESWTELASCPCVERYHPAMVQVNDKIYVGLGANEFGDLDDWWEYDIATDTWTEKTGFPSTERHHPYYFGIGDYVYVGFGHHTSTIFNDFYQYDPSTDTWTTLADFPEQGRVAGTQFSYAGKGYILSGQGETHTNLPTGEFWEYDPDTDSWVELPAHPSGGRWAPGSFVIEDEIFFTCGQANTGEKRDMMVYGLGGPASVDELVANQLTVSPNPSTGIVAINGITLENATASIFDTAGQLLYEVSLTDNQLDLTHLLSGMYILQIQNNQGIATKKLVIE